MHRHCISYRVHQYKAHQFISASSHDVSTFIITWQRHLVTTYFFLCHLRSWHVFKCPIYERLLLTRQIYPKLQSPTCHPHSIHHTCRCLKYPLKFRQELWKVTLILSSLFYFPWINLLRESYIQNVGPWFNQALIRNPSESKHD